MKPKSSSNTDRVSDNFQFERWLTLGVAIVIGTGAGILYFTELFDEATQSTIAGGGVKLALMFFILWLCWPAVIMLKRMKGGRVMALGGLGAMAVIAFRPRLLLLYLPAFLIAILGSLAMKWLVNQTGGKST